MRAASNPRADANSSSSLIAFLIQALVLMLPGLLLLLAGLRTAGATQQILCLGSGFQVLVCAYGLLIQRNARQPLNPLVITLYLIALAWLWLAASQLDDWYPHFAQGLLLLVPLLVFALQTLTNSGTLALRRARLLAERLASRRNWPEDLYAIRDLPDVKALREALYLDATPALKLLQHPELPVRVAALAALEFRKDWRPVQAHFVLQAANQSEEPVIRAATVSALANADDRLLIENLANFLLDPCPEVRRAAMEALFWDVERRWSWIRHAVRQNLADPAYQEDGPLCCNGQPLPAEIVADLNAWVTEKGMLPVRAAQSLGLHYGLVLSRFGDDGLVPELQRRLADPHAPAALRIELARVLQNHGYWSDELLHLLLEQSNPAPLRLMAAEALLGSSMDSQAVAALYDIARLPNREIALATAEVVQRCLGVDLGLPMGQPLPEVQSRQAAEVTRRVIMWAAQAREGAAREPGKEAREESRLSNPALHVK